MRKTLLLALLCTILVMSTSMAQTPIHGRETLKAVVNFTELANYYRLHPTPLVRKPMLDEDDEERPAKGPVDPSKVFLYHPEAETRRVGSSHSAFLPVSPAPADTFLSTTSDNTAIPPDTHGAVDSNYCVTMINTAVTIQTRTGGAVSSVSLDNFWTSVLPGGPGSFDPRVHYDPYSHRWIIGCLAYGQTATAQLMIGASATSDPTGTWYLYSVVIDPTGTNWLDYDNIGFNKNYIVLCGNPFGVTSGASNGAEVYVFNKDSVLSGVGAPYTSFVESSSFSIAPAITYDSASNDLFMLEDYDNTTGELQLWKVSGPVASPTLTSVGFPTAPAPWQWESNAVTGTAGADFAPQVGSTRKLQTNDARVYSCVERNGKIWCAHNAFYPYSTTANPTRSSIMWWQIDTSGTVNQNGLIDDPTNTNFYFFPSVAVNKNNDALIGYSTSSAAIHPYCVYSLHMSTDPADSVRPRVVYRHGQAAYYQTFGGGKNRWGDYSNTCVDPKNDTDFFTIQECVPATPANYWDTWWAYVKMCYPVLAPTAGTEPLPCAGSTASYSVSSVSGATGYTWTVSGTGWSGSSTTNTISLTAGAGVGTISVVATNACSTSPALVFTVNPSPLPGKPTITSPTIPCGSTAASYTASATNATSYNWTVLGTGWSGTSSTSILNAVVATGTGTIIATGVNACGVGTNDTITSVVPVGSIPGAPTAGVVPTAPCSGTTNMYTVGAATGATSYSWTVSGAGWSGTSTTDTIDLVTGTATAVVTVTGVSACGAGPAYIFTVVPSLLPSAPVITSPSIPCGTTSGIYTATASSATGYNWSVTGSGWSGSSTTGTINVVLGTGTGTITCSASNSCGTSALSTITSAAPDSLPAPPTAPAALPTACILSVTSFSVTPSLSASSYVWTVAGTGWSGTSTSNTINLTVGSGVATLSATAVNGCGSSAAFVFTVAPTPSSLPKPTITVPLLPCGSGVVATVIGSSSGASNYIWNVLGISWSGASTSSTINVTVGTGIGTVVCTAVNACGTSLPDTITVTPAPAMPGSSTVINVPSPVCSGNYEVFSTPIVPYASEYQWTVSGAGWSGSSTTNTITLAIGSVPATISVTGVNGCGAPAPYSITVVPILTPISAFSIQNHTTIVSAIDTIKFTGTGYLATAYAWTFGTSGFASPGTGSGPQAVHWMSTGLKTITLNVSDSGCSTTFEDTVLVLSSLNVPELSSKDAGFTVVPNPNNGTFDVTFSKVIDKPFEIRIVDMNGRITYQNKYAATTNNKVSIVTDGLPSGTYIISLIVGDDIGARTLTIVK